MRRTATPISHDHDPLNMWNQCANGRGSISLSICFARKISKRSSDSIRVELFGAYTLQTNVSRDLTLAGMAGVFSLTSSVDMEIDPSPRRLIVSTTGSVSSRERKAVIQVFLDSPTNFPPQSAPLKWWKPNRALHVCLPTAFTRSQTSISRCFAPFPVSSFSFVSAPRCPRDTRSMSSTRTSVLGDHTSTSR